MTLKEIRMVKHLVDGAREMIVQDGAEGLLSSYEHFERAMWHDDHDMHPPFIGGRRVCAALPRPPAGSSYRWAP